MAKTKSTRPRSKTPNALERPDDDHTDRRIRAYLASVRQLKGSGYDEAYHHGRSLIERLALSSSDIGNPTLELSALDCADMLHFVYCSEPFDRKRHAEAALFTG